MTFFRNVVWFGKGLREYTKSGHEKASRSFQRGDLNVDIGQRSCMITGANSGIGWAAAMAIAKHGGTVHLVCRNRQSGEQALQEIREASGNMNVFLHELDISKPRDVVAFAQSFEQSGKPLHVLINNAGCLLKEKQVTADDLEATFATNTLGTHIMTSSFVPILSKSEDPRVITVTSGGMLTQKLDLTDLQFAKHKPFDGTMAYAQTKRHQVIMTEQYALRWPKIHFSCMHPGWADTPGVRSSLPDFHRRMKDKLRTADQGADTVVWLALTSETSSRPSGQFFQDRKAVSVHLPLAWTRSEPTDHKRLMEILEDMSTQLTK
ncbi:hypothetical protein ACOMHN_047174 [Nucella lapillus]